MPKACPMAAAIDAFLRLCAPGIFNFKRLSAITPIFLPLPFWAICFENLLSGKKNAAALPSNFSRPAYSPADELLSLAPSRCEKS